VGQGARGRLQGARGLGLLPVFGNVGQVREVAERADDGDRAVGRQALEQLVQILAGMRVALAPVGHSQLSDALDEFEGLASFLFSDDLAQDAAQVTDVGQQGGRGGGGGGTGGDGGSAGGAASGRSGGWHGQGLGGARGW